MVANQPDCFKEEKIYIIISLLTENCELRKIYRKMCDVKGESSFSQNMFPM